VSVISPAYSRYLDFLRGLAALIVALSHLKLFGIANNDFGGWLPDDGHDAVVLFFILSGFVIAASTDKKSTQGLRNYLLDRAARIYSVAVPILLLAAALGAIGWIKFPHLYQLKKLWLYIPFHLTFLSQSWQLKEIPFGLNPWWSLPFEVWYYILFGCAFFLKSWLRVGVCLFILMIMGPKLWVMLPIWFVGVWLYRNNIANCISQSGALLFFMTGPLCYLLFMETPMQNWVRDFFLIPFGGWEAHQLGYASYFGRDYVTTLFFVVHLIGAQRLAFKMPGWLAKAATGLASVSFTLYLLHPIVYRVLSTGFMQPSANPMIVYGIAALSVAFAFIIAPITEGQRRNWRRLFARLTFNGSDQSIG
jgi:peptidoglycan/LPS O-acetylase OafA/YrhL